MKHLGPTLHNLTLLTSFFCSEVVSLPFVVVVIQSLSRIRLFATPWTAVCQAPLSPGVCSNSCPLSWWCFAIYSFTKLASFLPSSLATFDLLCFFDPFLLEWDGHFLFSLSYKFSHLLSSHFSGWIMIHFHSSDTHIFNMIYLLRKMSSLFLSYITYYLL